jgi:hypothetical protein
LSTALEPTPLPGSLKFSTTGSAGRTAYEFRRSATPTKVEFLSEMYYQKGVDDASHYN